MQPSASPGQLGGHHGEACLIPAVAAPVIAGIVVACGTWFGVPPHPRVNRRRREDGFEWGQIATASLVALSHGTK